MLSRCGVTWYDNLSLCRAARNCDQGWGETVGPNKRSGGWDLVKGAVAGSAVADSPVVPVKCTRPSARSASGNVRYPSSRAETVRSTAASVLPSANKAAKTTAHNDLPQSLPRDAIALGGRFITYALRESTRARRLGLWIAPETGLVVTAPPGSSPQAVRALLERHRRWILRWVERLDGSSVAPHPWPYGPTLLYRGAAHTVLIRKARAVGVERTPDDRLLVSSRAATLEGARRVLRRWMTSEAVRILDERVAAWSAHMALRARRVYVRNLRRRWGSCWPGGSLSFNYRLVMVPPAILDYVVVHELAHLRHPNHSPAFWALVADHAPDHQAARCWLRTCGSYLGL